MRSGNREGWVLLGGSAVMSLGLYVGGHMMASAMAYSAARENAAAEALIAARRDNRDQQKREHDALMRARLARVDLQLNGYHTVTDPPNTNTRPQTGPRPIRQDHHVVPGACNCQPGDPLCFCVEKP